MTQEEKYAILGKTRVEYREAKSDFGAIRKRHAEFVAELEKFLVAMKRDPSGTYAAKVPQGTLQAAIEFMGAHYFYCPSLADRLTLDAVGDHLNEYRAISAVVEDRRKSLIEQGEDDPGGIE